MTGDTPEFYPLGIDGILVRFARVLTEQANAQALAFRDAVAVAALPGVGEIASSLTSVRVSFDQTVTSRMSLMEQLRDIAQTLSAQALSPKRIWHIPVAFGPDYGPQLAEAAALAGVTEDQAIAEITGQDLRVIAIGFAPGQPYLGMLPPHWDIPRQGSLTESLPRGALIAAVRQLIIWAADAPTGWRHIGQTAFEVYRPDAAEPFAFAPGDAVRFARVSDHEFSALRQGDGNGGARCEVLR